MAHPHADDTTDDARPTHVTLTTDHVTADNVGPLTAALHAAGVMVERHTFLPVRGEEQHPWGVLLLAASGPPAGPARQPRDGPSRRRLSPRRRPRGWGTSGAGHAPTQG